MKVRLLTGRVSLTGVNNAGDVIDVPEAEAMTLIDRNLAEPVTQSRVAGRPESAMLEPPKPKRRKAKHDGRN
tara:strand:- start:2861 stop:3076 length:216 start_codon:yes stop_codon:yes gene_type:complete